MDSGGKLGLGTSSPSYLLDVNGQARFSGNPIINGSSLDINPASGQPNISFRSNNTYRGYLEGNSSGGFSIGTGSAATIAMTIDSSQRVGIGTTNPSQLLHIVGATTGIVKIDGLTRGGCNTFNLNGTQTSVVGNIGTILGDSTAGLALFAETGNEIRLYTNGSATPRVIVDTSGRLLVGTTSGFYSTTVKLQGNNAAATGESRIRFCRGQATPADGVDLGILGFSDNTETPSAEIKVQRDGGTWSVSSVPGKLVFSTTPDGGSSSTPRMTINSAGHVLPGSDISYDLGSTSLRWRNLYTTDLHLSNEGNPEGNQIDGTTGNWTIQEGEESLYIINNKSLKKYKFFLEEIT
jgi:hypothetical protein